MGSFRNTQIDLVSLFPKESTYTNNINGTSPSICAYIIHEAAILNHSETLGFTRIDKGRLCRIEQNIVITNDQK